MSEEPEKKEAVDVPQASVGKVKSHGPLFGGILFGIIILIVFVTLGTIGWGAYKGYLMNKERVALPSIQTLPKEEAVAEVAASPKVVPAEESKTVPAATPSEDIKQAKATDLKVLNGGAAKGSATTAADVLKKDGYTKVTTGNTLADFAGVTVYYAAGLEKIAEIVKAALLKTYPNAAVKPAQKDKSETSLAPLTVILGK